MNLGPSGPALTTPQKDQIRTAIGAAATLGADDNYMTDAEKAKLAAIAAGAEVNVQPDWNAVSGDAQILNKPAIPAAETQGSILTKIGDGTRIGAEFMPNALSGEGAPNAVAASAILGEGNSAILFTASVSGSAGNALSIQITEQTQYEGAFLLDTSGPDYVHQYWAGSTAVGLINQSNAILSAVFVATPAPGSNGSGALAPGTVALTGGANGVTPTHIGQLYRDNTNNVWYRATSISPPSWELDAPVSVASLQAIPAADMKAYLASLGVVLNA